MPTKSRCFAPVRGKAMRATKVDACGAPIFGEDSSVVTEGFVSIAFTANTDDGEEISVTNAAGKVCVRDTPCPKFLNYGIEIEFCNVDPYLYAMLTGQAVIYDPVSGDAIGFTVSTAADACAQGFALEVWTGAPGGQCGNGVEPGGYILMPFVQGGVIGDFTIENGAISFTVTGAITKDGSSWGTGPYPIEAGEVLPKAITKTDHMLILQTTMTVPTPYCGPVPTLDPADAALTGVTADATLLSVDFSPTPVGTDPWWVDFGDGEWDYSATGADITHVYDAAGTYTYTAYRGATSFTGTVTVTAA